MNKYKSLFLSLITATMLLSGCGNANSSSINPTTSNPTTMGEVTSQLPTTVPSISTSTTTSIDNLYEEALKNTKYYNLTSSTSTKIYEIHEEDFYYSSPYFTGYF